MHHITGVCTVEKLEHPFTSILHLIDLILVKLSCIHHVRHCHNLIVRIKSERKICNFIFALKMANRIDEADEKRSVCVLIKNRMSSWTH